MRTLTQISQVSIKSSIFDGKFKLRYSLVEKEALFESCKFKKLTDFYGTTFNVLSFNDSRFYKMMVLTEAIIKEKIDFEYAYFFDIVQFRDLILENNKENKLDFIATTFEKPANFLNMYSDKNKKEIILVGNRETARIIKDSFEQQNNIIEANKFYALEMKERDKELKWKTDFFEKLVFKFHGISSNHSQNWLLALFWILVIGMLSSTIDFFYFSNEPCIVYDFSIANLSLAYSGIFIFYYLITTYFDGNYFKTTLSLFAIVPIYWYLTRDFLFCNFSKTINPFSIMKSAEDINIIQLFFKIIIAYLIYQLIISIRQNTRRK